MRMRRKGGKAHTQTHTHTHIHTGQTGAAVISPAASVLCAHCGGTALL